MHKPLSYVEIFSILEELAQLRGEVLMNAVCESENCYSLQFSHGKFTRWVTIDLTPAQPFILSTAYANPHKMKRPTPLLNFLKAHFKGLVLQKMEMAEKPNRTMRLIFESESKLVFECFPHGVSLCLYKEDKKVGFPKPKIEGEMAYVEVDSSPTWKLNEEWALNFGLGTEKLGPAKKSPQEQALGKIKKSIEKMEENKEAFIESTQEHIKKLETKALDMKSQKNIKGADLEKVYTEIKKHKRKLLEYGEKKNLLLHRLKVLEENPVEIFLKENLSEKEGAFKGTRVVLDQPWQLWVGRNASQNDELIRLASPHELWIHLRDYASAHGLIRGPKNQEPSQAIIDFSCLVLAQLSQGKKNLFAEGDKVDFIVTPRKFLKKKKGMAQGAVHVERETVRRIAYKSVTFVVL